MNAKRNEAVELLRHYFALAMGKRSASELSSDARMEIESIVDCIMEAVAFEMRAE